MNEIRAFDFDVRAEQNDEHGHFLSGRPIVFGQRTDLGWYDEIIEADALTETDLRDVRFLVNHNIDMIPLARSRNNNANSTMQMSVGPEGMDIRVDLDTENNADAKSLYSAVERGDISGMSFMFSVDKDSWDDIDSEHPTRHIRSISRVLEVSAVTFPAYTQTSIQARGLSEALDSAKESLESARAELRAAEEREEEITESVTEKPVDELLERQEAIEAEKSEPEANLDELDTEARAISEELERRKAEEAERQEIRAAVAGGAGEVTEKVDKIEKKGDKKMFNIDSIEYRDAWVKKIVGRELNEEERSALSSAGAVIPTMTVNAVWDKLVKPAELLGKVDVMQFPNYVRLPVATTNNAARADAVGASISESSDVIAYVDLVPNEYCKLLTVGADIEHMAIPAVHDWIVDNLVGQIKYAINKDIVVGSGSNALKGLTASINANATAIPATVTKASLLKIMATLGANYQNGAIWIMTPKMFFEDIMSATQLNDYVINNGFEYKLFGHDVVLMSECAISSKETIFYGDPKAYKVNIFKPLEVKPFESATTTNFQFRGACLADGELLDTSAFVRFAQT